MKILITGFESFGGESINPAYEAVKLLPDTVCGAQIVKLEVPTVFGKAGDILHAAVAEHRPDAVICVGQAGGRAAITSERVAINIMDGRIADNAGFMPVDRTIRTDGENAYFSTLPIKAMVAAIRAEGIPAEVSNTAGTYVCNYLMYTLLYIADKEFPSMRGGFIHVPYSTEQTVDKRSGTPGMDIRTIARGLEAAVRETAKIL